MFPMPRESDNIAIPVWDAELPDWSCPEADPESPLEEVPWYGVQIPGDYLRLKPKFGPISAGVDGCLKQHLDGRHVIIRALSIADHPGLSVDDLIAVIRRLGHDRYDAQRPGNLYDNVDDARIDLFALPFTIKEECSYLPFFLEPFYYLGIAEHGRPNAIDLLTVYDRAQMKQVPHRYEGREDIKRDGYAFRYPDRKPDALLGIVRTVAPGATS